ncbi:MAG: hypothetical protein EI684_05810 [Candidatus Viridilinea halotolerans]|uniref:Histidine kinase/HSP90-like ATPase domain-containing protein n=1 Tax=Candidatus Viridilinea halotolerans TaxID=2491704 RepID=A0A426U4Z0_9CHLR|nr:MAG: hypothetical protein EI684_05810 [Candidatus Viridilinea halotolerans]
MKPSSSLLPGRLSAQVAFYSYRWLAWAVAALALTLPGRPVETLPRDAGLLLLAGVINVVATTQVHQYVRLVQLRPRLLLLDLLGCAALLWFSGSAVLPFLPYALSSLILPALLFGWPGGLVAAFNFLMLDLLGLMLFHGSLFAEYSGLDRFGRLLMPVAFTLVCITLERMLHARAAPMQHPTQPLVVPSSPPQPPVSPPSMANPTSRSSMLSERQLMRAALFPPLPPRTPLPLVITRALEQHANPVRRLRFELVPHPNGAIIATLEQLGAGFGAEGGFNVRVSSEGTLQPLAAAQQIALLHTAQEALRNVQQHAQAHTVLIHVAYAAETVTLTIHDDGIGLANASYERPGMHALRAMRYRILEFDGEFAVLADEHGGTTVQVVVPYV